MNWLATGALLMVLGVGLGAFGAHGLRNRLDAGMLDVYRTAALYHFLHALGILFLIALARSGAISTETQNRVCWLLLIGIILFSGSLYALSISGVRALGAITPIGGLAFLAGWTWLLIDALRRPS